MTKANIIIGVLIALILFFVIGAALIPELQSSTSQLNESNYCEAISGNCIYNATVSSSSPCRNESNQVSSACDVDVPTEVPLGNLFGTVLVIVVMAGMVLTGIAATKRLRGGN